jgi:cytochrome c oxidase subunit IV
MTASKIYLYIYTVTVISDCVPEKVAYLKLKGTLVFQPTILFIVVGHCILIASTISK